MRLLFLALVLAMSPLAARAQQQVVFSEVMYNPAAGKPEFIEIWNIANTPLDIEKWTFTQGLDFQFPNFSTGAAQAHFLKPQERIILSAADAATTRAAYPSIPAAVRIFGPWSASTELANSGETITLIDRNNVIVTTLSYEDDGHWPISADGAGHSLVLANENRTIDDWRNWRQSVNSGGSPGLADPAVPAAGLAVSEVHFSPTTGRVDWVELRNNGLVNAAAGTLFLSGTLGFADKVALSGSVPTGGYVSFNVDFPTDDNGDARIYLIDANNHVKSAAKLRRATGRDSWQVFPAGGAEWYSTPNSTRDLANNPTRNNDIVINEIMADPPSNQRDAEFIELYNRGAATVDLGGWQLDEAVNFVIPPGTLLPPGGYLVIGANKTYLNSAYAGLAAMGDWSGRLGNNGQLIRLLDQFGNLANEVDYRFGGEWPDAANGNGSTLELVNPAADNRFGVAWRDSDESQKSTFQTFTINGGTYQKGGTTNAPQPIDDEIRIWAVSDAHIIMRNIVMRPTAGTTNVFTNPNVTTLNNNNLEGWQSRGTHWATFHDSEGVHLVADGHGDNKLNHIEKDSQAMLGGTPYTLTFEARWISGKPRLVTQSWDTSWGGTVRVPVPSNLGTPGQPNSRFAANVPPQITSLLHSPPVPNQSQTVTVTARVSSNTPLSAVQVLHRRDSVAGNTAWNTTTMNDAGTSGDTVAGDGVWSAQIVPSGFGYSGNYGAEFYVRATATNGAVTNLPRNGAAHPGMWVADSQNPGADLRRMRIVISQYWLDALSQDSGTGGNAVKFNYKYPRLSNRYFPCTFISNENDIYYASTVRKTGSPYTRQTDNTLGRGRVSLPGDKRFRGKSKLYWDNDAGASLLHNRITRYWLYLFGVPGNQNEVCRVTRNSDSYSVRETSEVFDKDMLDRIWENGSDGQFFELDDKFWIADDGSTRLGATDGDWGYKGTDSTGYDNPTFYHNQDIPKSREPEYDYGGYIDWTRQASNAGLTQEVSERISDVRSMTALAAVRGYIGDWDNLTIRRGKNGYFYQRSTDHKWMLIQWDSDLAFQNTGESVLGTFPGVGNYFGRPFNRRYLNYYLTEMLNAYSANGARIGAWLTAEENAATSYTANTQFYKDWSTGRASTIQGFIGGSLSSSFLANTPPNNSTVTAATVDVSGLAPSSAFSVVCVNHPEAVLTWGIPDVANWKLSGIRLKTGLNTLAFRRFDFGGVQIGADLSYNITKTGNAAPVMSIVADPSSFTAGLGELVIVDASGSADPDGSALTYVWTVTPSVGVSVSYPTPSKATATFSKPGTYTFTVQGTNAASVSASISRDVTVTSAQDFESFGASILSPMLTVTGTELLDNYSLSSWYSLTTRSGNLNLQITDAGSRPLDAASAFPRIFRPLPAATDFTVQTELTLETRYFGSFFTGLIVETTENGVRVKYAFGVDGGATAGNAVLALRRSTNNAAYSLVGATSVFPGVGSSGTNATLRVRRLGAQLQFQRLVNGTWVSIQSVTMGANPAGVQAGVFASTSAAQSVRVAFDYLLVADPGATADLVSSLRITELMYNPAGSGGVEFVELKNIGLSALELGGVYFEIGLPFDERFTFPSLTLQPGAYCVVTNDSPGFQALYGTGLTIAGQYVGNLSNGGEEIHLKDANDNTILNFTYGDSSPWPKAADGNGKSLEIRNPNNTNSYYGAGANWIASAESGGSPGYLGLAVDNDGDGQPDAYEVVFGSDGSSPNSRGGLVQPTRAANGDVTLSWSSVTGRTYTILSCDNLGTPWVPLTTVTATSALSTYIDTTASTATNRFYKISTAVP